MRRNEEGFALITAIMVMAIALLLASAAILSATATSNTANRDRSTKRALQAADAGIRAATFHMNRLDVVHSTLPCVAGVSGGVRSLVALSVTTGWCPPVTENLGNGQSFSYVVSPAVEVNGAQVTLDRTIVATGTAGGVTRRVATTASALRGTPLFGDATMISLRDLSLRNSTKIFGNTRSNGSISLSNSAKICGNATPGPGRAVTTSNSATVCPGFSTAAATAPLVLPPVDEGNAATANDNARICSLDPCSRATGAYNPVTKRLTLGNQASVSLGGSVYWFCNVDMGNNSTLIIAPRAAGTSVRIYIGAPESCGGTGGSFTKGNGSDLVNNNTAATALQIYVRGSSTIATSVNFVNNNVQTAGTPLTVYAPQSTVNIQNHARIKGAVAAQQINMDNNTQVDSDPTTASLATQSLLPIYRSGRYRECTPVQPSTGLGSGC